MEQKEYKILLAVVPSLMLILGILIGLTYAKVKIKEEPKTPPVVIAAEIEKEEEPAEEESAEKEMVSEYISLGEFKITYYCPCEKCSEGYGNNTATGVKAQANHTVAADPNILPYGTEIIINGQAYTVEDTGGALKGKRIIDIYVDSHDDIPSIGTYNAEVFLK